VVTGHGSEPRFPEQLEPIEHARATINDIPYTDEAIHCTVESNCLESLVQIGRFEVDITHNEVPAMLVNRQS
jgi:hypothetical protein